MSRVQVKLSKVQGWYCLLGASGFYSMHEQAKHRSELELCCLWLCVPAPGGSPCECLSHGMFGHSVGKPSEAAHCHLLLPPLWYQMWLWCLWSAGESPSGKHRPTLYTAYKGYMKRWREICWAGTSESISCDKRSLILMWQSFLVCSALWCLCILNHQKYPCPGEFTGCRRKVGNKLCSLFTGRELC